VTYICKNNLNRLSTSHTYFLFLADLLASRDIALPAHIDWDRLIQLAADEAVLPALHSRLTSLGFQSQIPDEIRDFLSAYTELNYERNRQILSELAEHAARLNALGIEPVALKGSAYLLEKVFSKADRLLLDIDLLVPAPRLADAYEAFLAAGFRPEIPDASALALLHKPALTRPGYVDLEFHHRLLRSGLLPADECFARSSRVHIGDAWIRIPSPEDQLVHLIAHSQVHHGYEQRIWPPLRAQYDLYRLATHFAERLDWSAIRTHFQNHGFGTVFDLHLRQVHENLGLRLFCDTNPNALTSLRWQRRKVLAKHRWVRFFDPLYLFRTWAEPRIRMAQSLWKIPAGRRYLIETPFRPAFYRKLLSTFR
jgi:Uncharacterised nucleotidyltransferase